MVQNNLSKVAEHIVQNNLSKVAIPECGKNFGGNFFSIFDQMNLII